MRDSTGSAELLRPYAQALMSIAQSNNLADQFGEEIDSLLVVLDESADLRNFLANPIIDADAKKNVLRQVVGDQVHPYLRSFLLLLIERRRIVFLEGICKQYQVLLRELNQTVLAEVSSTTPLNDTQQQAIRDKVIAMTGARNVELKTSIDLDLIGGVVIKVGSQIVDASLRGQLRRISLRLNSAS